MYEPKPKLKISSFTKFTNLEMAFCDPFPIVWRYCMVLDSVVCYCMVILWHYMVYHVSISWYWMVLYDVAMVKYIDLPTEGPRSQNQIIIFETWHKPLFACWPILQSHFLLFYKKKLLLWPGQMVRSKSFKAFLHFFVSVIWSTWQRSATHFHLSKTNVATKGSSSYCCLLTHVWNKSDCYKT